MAGSNGPFVPSFHPSMNIDQTSAENAQSWARFASLRAAVFSEAGSRTAGAVSTVLDLTDNSNVSASSGLFPLFKFGSKLEEVAPWKDFASDMMRMHRTRHET